MKKLFQQKNKKEGFTLVETLVAVSIFTVSIMGLSGVLANGISETTYAKQKLSASYLAQEGIEYARNMRDTFVLYSNTSQEGWNNFKLADFTYASPFPEFTRVVQMVPIPGNADEVKIFSTVSWSQGSGDYDITFSENLFNWVE